MGEVENPYDDMEQMHFAEIVDTFYDGDKVEVTAGKFAPNLGFESVGLILKYGEKRGCQINGGDIRSFDEVHIYPYTEDSGWGIVEFCINGEQIGELSHYLIKEIVMF